jgi:hypothetical protein
MLTLSLSLSLALTLALSTVASTSAFANVPARRGLAPLQYTSAWGLPTLGRQRQCKVHMSTGASKKYGQWYAVRGDKWNPKR